MRRIAIAAAILCISVCLLVRASGDDEYKGKTPGEMTAQGPDEAKKGAAQKIAALTAALEEAQKLNLALEEKVKRLQRENEKLQDENRKLRKPAESFDKKE